MENFPPSFLALRQIVGAVRKKAFCVTTKHIIKYTLRLILFYQSRSCGNKSFYESHSHEDITLAKSKLETNSALCL